MIVPIPDHYAPNVGGALVERGARVIAETKTIPAYIHQYAELWNLGLRYDGAGVTYWQAVGNHDKSLRTLLRDQGLIL